MTTPFPWYDAVWLNRHVVAKAIVERTRAGLLPKFVESFARFFTRPDFSMRQIGPVFDEFTAGTLPPGQALLFSGSSQRHYRNLLSPAGNQGACKLLFLPFVPEGLHEVGRPENRARILEIPEPAVIAK